MILDSDPLQRKTRHKYIFLLLFMALVTKIYVLNKAIKKSEPEMVHTLFYPTNMTAKSTTCKEVKFSSTPLPKIALASFPGSGNTWTRHLIQQSTDIQKQTAPMESKGIATGGVYNDIVLKKNGFPGENIRNSSVIVIKTHGYGKKLRRRFKKSIIVIRDPFDAFLAEFNRIHDSHTGYAKEIHFRKEWEEFVAQKIDRWRKFYKDWLRFSGPLHLVVYEDLKLNLSDELIKLVEFLGMKIAENDLLCVLRNSKGNFKRSKTNDTNHDRYTTTMRKQIIKIKQEVQNAINRRRNLNKRIY